MIQDSSTDIVSLRKMARKLGGQIFLWATAATLIGVGLVIWEGFDLEHARRVSLNSWRMEESILHTIFREREAKPIFSAAVLASIGYVVVAWWLGRYAGSAIVVKRRGFAWVGPLTLLLPAVIGSCIGACVWYLGDESFARSVNRDPLGNLVALLIAFILLLWVVGILIGLLAGLYVRQQGRLLRDIEAWNANIDAHGVPQNQVKSEISAAQASSWGMAVAVAGAGFISMVRIITYCCIATVNWRDNFEWSDVAAFILPHIIYLALAAWSGRILGRGILLRKRRGMVAGAAAMIVPSVGLAISYIGMRQLLDPIDPYFLRTYPLDYLILPVLEHALIFCSMGFFVGALGGFLLRHLEERRQTIDPD